MERKGGIYIEERERERVGERGGEGEGGALILLIQDAPLNIY